MKTPRDLLIASLDERMTALRSAHRHPFRRSTASQPAAMRWEIPRAGTPESIPC